MVRAVLLTLLTGAALLNTAGPATAAPVAAAPATPVTTHGALLAVDCVSDAFCVAAGRAPEHVDDEEQAGLLDVRDGTGWRAQHVQPRAAYVSLYGVSCRTAASCLAVGADSVGNPVAAAWAGSRWTLVDAPAEVYAFHAVDCPTQRTCVAVGIGEESPQVAATWDGSGWTTSPIAGAAGARLTFLDGVSCPTARWCLAVGHTVSAANVSAAVSAVFDGTTWSVEPVPTPPAGTSTSTLADVDCTSRTSCVATGSADGSTLAQSWDGSTWSRTPTAPGAVLSGVSCSAPARCLAVGAGTAAGGSRPIAQRWDGSTWTPTPAPVPSGDTSQLRSVSCTAPNRCIAVGYAQTVHPRRSYTVAQRWTGTRWVVEAP